MFENNESVGWTKLDNAAKIFPCTTTEKDPKVFRTACELYERVEPEVLQSALDKTVEHFPCFRCVLKKGIFWYYFEQSSICPKIHPENKIPCSPIYTGDSKKLLFDVSYFENRINLEIYHALADGTGAVNFLKTLIFYYLTEKHSEDFKNQQIQVDYDASEAQKQTDSFFKYYSKSKKIKAKKIRAYKMRGQRFDGSKMSIIEGVVSTRALLDKAHEYEITITALLVAVLIDSIHEGMALRDEGRSVCITVPVNLRNYFKSESARNFFAAIRIEYNFKKNGAEFCKITEAVSRSLKEKLNPEYLRRHMNGFSEIENKISARIVPVSLKNPAMRAAEKISQKGETAALSNVGRITLRPELSKYVRFFDVFVSTAKLQICACSFEDNFVISFTSDFVDNDIQRCFFRKLAEMGIQAEISTNLHDDGE